MHSSNDNGGGNKRTSSSSIIEQIGPGPNDYKIYELSCERSKLDTDELLQKSSKPNTQLDSSSATSAGSSEDKGKSKWWCCC
ncbi:MAG: hypothetical protein ACEY3B_05350 [Wolbachia sp.]